MKGLTNLENIVWQWRLRKKPELPKVRISLTASGAAMSWPTAGLCQPTVATDSSGYAHFNRALDTGQQALLDLLEQHVMLLSCPLAHSP